MRIVIDRERCAATGMCTSIAPANFELDDAGALVVKDEGVLPETLELIESAVACCPMEAISIAP